MTYNHRVILRTISVIMLFEGCAMLIPLVCAVYYQEGCSVGIFLHCHMLYLFWHDRI